MGMSIDELLTGKPSKESAPEKVEEKAEEKKEEVKEEVKEPENKEPEEKMVPLKALQDERMKRRQAKQKADELEARLAKLEADKQTPYYGNPNETENKSPSIDPAQYKADRLQQTVNTVRATRTDADEMLNLFDEAVEQDESIYQKMMDQSDPGTFAYEFGKQVAVAKKYGATPEEAYKRAFAEGEKVAKEKLVKELKTKKDLGEKLPKDLSQGGQSQSGSDTAEWTRKSSKEIWG